VNSLEQPAWVERALRRVEDDGVAKIVLVVRNVADAGPRGAGLGVRAAAWWRNRRFLLYAAYVRWDTRRFRAPDDPFASRDITPLTAGATHLDCRPRQTKYSDYWSDEDVARARAAELDVVWRLGFRILRGDALRIARHGVWSFHHGDNRVNRGGPAGFWEVMEEHPHTGLVLQVLSEELDGGRVLYRSTSATNVYSVAKNKHEHYWKGSDVMVRTLTALSRRGPDDFLDPDRREDGLQPYSGRLYRAPTNRELAPHLLRLARRRAHAKVRDLTSFEQWGIAYTLRSAADGSPDLAPFRFRELTPPADRFWADPFPLTIEGRHYLLIEELVYAARRGHLSVLEVDASGMVGTPRRVLERDYHLSYPFTFEYHGARYLLPETAATGRLELYRAARPPFEWVPERVLMEGVALRDATLVEIEGRWWMFAGTSPPGAAPSDELSLFHADTPFGPWTPHERNPVVSDVRWARPAGALFRRDGSWYRPAQDSTGGYGAAIRFRRIVELTPERYREEDAGELRPSWDPRLVGLHTVNSVPGLTVIDVRRRRRRWPTTR
jgi:hypothetical protein